MVKPGYPIDREALADFTLRLVGERSPSGEEAGVAGLVRAEMERLGYDVEVCQADDEEKR